MSMLTHLTQEGSNCIWRVTMAVRPRTSIVSNTVRVEASNSNGLPPQSSDHPFPHFSFSKLSWVVRTESNVPKEIKKKSDDPCDLCEGSGKVTCRYCRGKGRTNYVDVEMLPKSKWPKWCKTCGGSGLDYCPRCLGTGEYRHMMGYLFRRRDGGDPSKDQIPRTHGPKNRSNTADFLSGDE